MDVSITFKLNEIEIDGFNILALSDLHVYPARQSLGKLMMMLLNDYSINKGYDAIVGFCEPSLVPFYEKCGYFINSNNYKYGTEDRKMISNVPFNDLSIEKTW